MFVKVHIQHAHASIDVGPGRDNSLAVDALAHKIERLAWIADALALLVMPTVVSTRRENFLLRELADTRRPYDVPHRDRAGSVNRERVYPIAQQGGAYEARRANEDKVRRGRERLRIRDNLARFKRGTVPAKDAPCPTNSATST